MINVEADRLREPAAWLMVAVASTRVLIGIERLLFGTQSLKDASFALRAAGHVEDLTSPVIPALLVGAVLLAGHAGPAIERLRLTIQVAVGTLGLAVLFGTVGLFGGLFAGETVLREKAEFLVGSLPALALTAIALFYLLPKAALAGSQGDALSSGGLRADTGSRRSRQQRPQEPRFQEPRSQGPRQEPRSQEQRSLEQYGTAHGHLPHGAPVHPQGAPLHPQSAPVHPQGGQPPQGFHPQDPAQGGPAYSQEQTPRQELRSPEQTPQQGFSSPEQGAPQGFQQHEQAAPQGFPSHDQAPQQGFHAQEQTPRQGLRSPEQTPQQGFSSPEQGAPQGFQQHERATQGGHAYPQQQFQPVPQPPYSPPALPPAPAASSSASSAEGHGGPQQAHGHPAPSDDVYGAPYGQPAERPYGGWSGSHAQSPAQPAHQAPAAMTEAYNSGSYLPGSYVPADAQPQPHVQPQPQAQSQSQAHGQAQATLYDPPPPVYDPPIYSERSQSSVYADPAVYAEPPPPAYAQPADSRLTGYSHQSEQPTSFYGTQPAASPYASADSRPQPSFDGQAQHSFPQSPQPEQQASFYGSQPEAPVVPPYTSADSHPPLSFDSQAQHSFPSPPDDYGQPSTGYPGAEYGRQTEPNLRYSAPAPAPDPVDPRSQQMAQAYQQAESYQQQSQGTDPQLRPEYTGSQPGGSYDDPFGHPQTPPAQQPYQQGDHRWDSLAETAPRLDTSAYRGDPLSGPSPVARPWDSQPIDPTAIYKPERSAQVTGEETPDRERVGPGQEQNMSWYGSDRREH